jgi:diguanylate cyclase (GGDEF)-like protein/PAS domain S-box-containing protein
MISLLVIIWINGNRELNKQFNFILSTETIVEKMHFVAIMSEIARNRTRLTSRLLATEDFFIKDEITLQLDVEGSNFSQARLKFLKLPLNSFEIEILEKQKNLISTLLTKQRYAIELAMSDDPALLIKAKELQYNEVLPRQGEVVDLFMTLLQLYEKNIKSQTRQAQHDYEDNLKLRYLLLFFFLAVAFFVVIYVSRKIYLIERTLFIEKKRTHITLMSIGDAVITTDANGIILDCNTIAEDLLRLSSEQMISRSFSSIVKFSEQKSEKFNEKSLISSLQENKKALTKYFELNFGEQLIYIELLFSPILEGKHKAGCVITFRDISDKKILEQQLHQQARHDALTGLLNRYSYEQLCKEVIEKQDKRKSCCLCVLDLDHFKNINDSCGHEAGDIVLKDISVIMSQSIREQDTLSRIGGDEFTLILRDCTAENAKNLMQKLIENISNYHFSHKGVKYTLGCSIGITSIIPLDTSCSDVFKRADSSCYHAKELGRNKVVIY